LAKSLAEINWIGTVQNPLESRNSDGTSSSAGNRGSSPHNLQSGLQTRANTSGVQAVRGIGDGSGVSGEVSSETSAALSSPINLLRRERSIVNTVRILTVELVLRRNDLTDLDKTIGNAVTATVIDFSAANTVSSTVFRELVRRDIVSKEVAALALTKEVRLSVAVVRDVPASSFEETEGDFGDL